LFPSPNDQWFLKQQQQHKVTGGGGYAASSERAATRCKKNWFSVQQNTWYICHTSMFYLKNFSSNDTNNQHLVVNSNR
jgi:hypothetical protein